MPIYEYQCTDCGHRFEVMQRLSEEPIATCTECGSPVEKLLSAPAFQFKGSGWYATDYAKKDKGSEGDSDSKDKKDKAGADTDGAKSKKADKKDKSSSDTSGKTP